MPVFVFVVLAEGGQDGYEYGGEWYEKGMKNLSSGSAARMKETEALQPVVVYN